MSTVKSGHRSATAANSASPAARWHARPGRPSPSAAAASIRGSRRLRERALAKGAASPSLKTAGSRRSAPASLSAPSASGIPSGTREGEGSSAAPLRRSLAASAR
ncbi:MAG: hypothetical protein LBG06_06315 [Deltaproteobacteria bacterium]|nr:hypothetical protein [Deltaproteobacteria bacterium]